MASIVVTGDSSGAITIAAPAVAGTNTLTLPASTGTLVVTGGAQTIEFADGSAAAPSITNSGDTNTGMFFPAADTIAFTEGGTEAMRLDSSGNMGIGTTSPVANRKLTIGNTGQVAAMRINAPTGYDSFIEFTENNSVTANEYWQINKTTSTHALQFWNGSERMRIDSSGNVGIGTTATTTYRATIANNGGNQLRLYATDVASSTTNTIDFWYLDSGGSPYNNTSIRSLSTANAGNGNLVFYTRPTSGSLTEAMRINSSGRVLINSPAFTEGMISIKNNTSSSGMSIGVLTNGDNAVNFYNASNTYISSIVVNSGTVAYNTSSDYRLKENIAPMTGALATVAQLNPVTWNWKADGKSGQGFVAHELQAVVPEAVTGEKDGMRTEQYEVSPAIPATYDEEGNELTAFVEAVMGEREVPKYQGIDTSFLVATLTAAIQEQQQIINDLKARIETLEGAK